MCQTTEINQINNSFRAPCAGSLRLAAGHEGNLSRAKPSLGFYDVIRHTDIIRAYKKTRLSKQHLHMLCRNKVLYQRVNILVKRKYSVLQRNCRPPYKYIISRNIVEGVLFFFFEIIVVHFDIPQKGCSCGLVYLTSCLIKVIVRKSLFFTIHLAAGFVFCHTHATQRHRLHGVRQSPSHDLLRSAAIPYSWGVSRLTSAVATASAVGTAQIPAAI